MQRLVLLGLGAAFFMTTQKCSSRCYSKAAVPFESFDVVDAWVTEYCECFQKAMDCSGDAQCVTDLWQYMYQDPDLKIFRDGEEIAWEVLEADTQTMVQHVDFTQPNGYESCELSSYGPYYVVIDEQMSLFFTSSVGTLFDDPEVPSATLTGQNKFTFNKEGTFARKERTSQNNVYAQMFTFFNGAQSAAASLSKTVMPHSFFADAPRELIVFVGCVALVMYLVLMFTIIRVASLCIRGKSASGGHQYDKVQYCTTATEIDQIGDVNEMAVVA